MLQTGLISGVIGLTLLAWQDWAAFLTPLTLPAIIYVIFCVCISQACYSALLNTTRFKHFTDLFLMEVPLCMIFESLILGIQLPLAAYAVVGISLGVILFIRWKAVE